MVFAAGEDPYFGIAALVLLVLVIGIFLLLGRYYPGSGAEQLDWKPARSYEDEVRLEMEDVDQMLEAQNERRRASGRPERNEDDVQAQIHADRRELQERAARYKRGDEESPGS
ncbi:MAG: hypothetical protein H0T15_06920 [Thermoleophilaceae bacterium]|nr:hypothetical protein [Thermoleophilaceae bacterium]